MRASAPAIEPLSHALLPECLALLDEALRPGHTPEWFAWKHEAPPAGASWGWVARDEGVVVGVRLVMRWPLRIDGQPALAARMVDTATRESHRGRGVFRRLTMAALDELARATDPPLFIMNTPNHRSRSGYQGMGWELLPPIPHGYHLVFPGVGGARVDTFSLADWPSPGASPGLETARTGSYMRWRYQAAPGSSYRWLRLRQAEEPNGLVYRLRRTRGVRVLLVMELLGSPRVRSELLAAAGKRERAILAIAPTGAGAWPDRPARLLLVRGGSVVAVRRLDGAGCGPTGSGDPFRLWGWRLSMGDLEDVL